jgi:hypothetical protein
MTRPRNLDRPARSCEDVNRELRARDRAEILVKGRGYFYFAEGFSHHWRTSSVPVYRLSDLTIRQWLERHEDFVEINRDREEAVQTNR